MQRAVVILGATATGKSALALHLAGALGGEIVNADALQAYRRLQIGTGKPTTEERAAVAHHLVDILDPSEHYSAGEFARRAGAAIAEIESRGKVPIVVGGSGLYLRALLRGIAPLPAVDPALKRDLRERLAREGLGSLRADLLACDASLAARLPATDTQRIVRGLEVWRATGIPLSEWIRRSPFGLPPAHTVRIGLTLPRAILYDRIAVRVRDMIAAGWLQEVERLVKEGCDPGWPAFQAIGYRQLARCVGGGLPLALAVEETIRATRRLAKRQETWFRREPDVVWLDARDPATLLHEAENWMRGHGVAVGEGM